MEKAQPQQIPISSIVMQPQTPIAYASRPFNINATSLLHGGFRVSSSSGHNSSIPYANFPSGVNSDTRYISQNSTGAVSSVASCNDTNSNGSSSSVMGRVERGDGSGSTILDFVTSKRPLLATEYMSTPRRRHSLLEVDENDADYGDSGNQALEEYLTDSWADRYTSSRNSLLHAKKPCKLRNKRNESYFDSLNALELTAPPIKRHRFSNDYRLYDSFPLNQAVSPESERRSSGAESYKPVIEPVSPTLPSTSPEPCPPPDPENAAEPPSLTDDKLIEEANALTLVEEELTNNPTELVNTLCSLEQRIKTTSSDIERLEEKQKKLQESITANKFDEEDDMEYFPRRIQIYKSIFTTNWAKVRQSQELFLKYGTPVDFPMYNQASDTIVYHQNRKKFLEFKPLLLEKIKREKLSKASREMVISSAYSRLSADWRRKVEKVESSQKRKAKEAKNREVFEKVFPELRKLREDRERFSRCGGRIKSEADLEEIMDGLQEQELEDKKMRSYAVIPPLLLDQTQKRFPFINTNGKVFDFEYQYRERQHLNFWTKEEKEVFKEKFLQHPKQFGIIASFLEKKTPGDCVAFYYSSKKTENYKRLLKRSRQRTRTKNVHSKVSGAGNGLGLDGLFSNTSGVTTRQQIQAQQKLEQPQQNLYTSTTTAIANTTVTSTSAANDVNNVDSVDNAADSTVCESAFPDSNVSSPAQTPPPSMSTNASSLLNNRIRAPAAASVDSKTSVPNSPLNEDAEQPAAMLEDDAVVDHEGVKSSAEESSVPLQTSEAVTAVVKKEKEDEENESSSIPIDIKPVIKTELETSDSNMHSEQKLEIKKKERRKDDKKIIHDDTSEEEMQTEEAAKGILYQCAVCKTECTSSRPLPKSHARLYGIKEEDILLGSRVCSGCRCKAVHARYSSCPFPTCPSGKGDKSKRLRVFPSQWQEAPAHFKQKITDELQIPSTATRCCTACYNRIKRKLVALGVKSTAASQLNDSNNSASPKSTNQSLRWTDEETEALKRGIAEHGSKWASVCQVVGNTKTQHQCKNFYFNFRKKLGLDRALQEYNKNHGDDETKSMFSTDEEESGSSRSDHDEMDQSVKDDSDTISASSPVNPDLLDEKLDMAVCSKLLTSESLCETSTTVTTSVITKSGASSTVPSHPEVGSATGDDASASNVLADSCSLQPSNSNNVPSNSSLLKEDYDSSATETADEGVSNAENESSLSTAPSSGLSNGIANAVAANGRTSTGKPAADDLTFKDLMLGVIEMQLMKNQNPPSSQDREIGKMRENSAFSSINVAATLHHPVKDSGAVIVQNQQSAQRGVDVVTKEPEAVTLDLSIKKLRTSTNEYSAGSNHVPTTLSHSTPVIHQPPSPAVTVSRVGTVPQTAASPLMPISQSHQVPHILKYGSHESTPNHYYHPPQMVEVARVSKTGQPLYCKFPSRQIVMQPHQLLVKQPPHIKMPNKGSSPQLNPNVKGSSSKQSPDISVMQSGNNVPTAASAAAAGPVVNQQNKISGSIMHGTPVSSSTVYSPNARDGRYDSSILRQMTPSPHPVVPQNLKESSVGSITQGTPVHQRNVPSSSSATDYYSPTTKRTANIPAAGFYPPRQQHSYSVEQRQIIMNDYLTSQQISSNVPTVRTQEKMTYYYPVRQGVIQRHNTNQVNSNISRSTSPHPYPPNHEILHSFADIAVRQPNLPVPVSNSPVNQLKEDKPRLLMQEGFTDRFSRDNVPPERYINRDNERYIRDSQVHQMHHDHVNQQSQLREIHNIQQQSQQQHHSSSASRDVVMSPHDVRDHAVQQHFRDQHKLLRDQQDRVLREQLKGAQQQQQQQQQHSTTIVQIQQQQQQQMESHNQLLQPSLEVDSSHQYPPPPPRVSSSGAGSGVSRIMVQEPTPIQSHVRIQQQQVPSNMYSSSDQHRSPVTTVAAESSSLDVSRVLPSSAVSSNRESTPSASIKQETLSRENASKPNSRHGESTTLTAASLIDAIITHQINQANDPAVQTSSSSSDAAHAPSQRPGEKLFQFPEPTSAKSFPVSHSIPANASPDVKQHQQQQPPLQTSHSRQSSPISVPQQSATPSASQQPQISPSRSSSTTPSSEPNAESNVSRSSSGQSTHVYIEPQSWKLRCALQQKELEQQNDRNIVRIAPPLPPNSPRQRYIISEPQPVPLFDYVRTKIEEVMRSDKMKTPSSPSMTESDENNESAAPPPPSSHPYSSSSSSSASSNYTYPFSALNINSQVPVSLQNDSATITQKAVDIPEPAPMLSSQYEPLSDEE